MVLLSSVYPMHEAFAQTTQLQVYLLYNPVVVVDSAQNKNDIRLCVNDFHPQIYFIVYVYYRFLLVYEYLNCTYIPI